MKSALALGIPYGIALVPFLALSVAIHGVGLGGYSLLHATGVGGTAGFEVESFGRPGAASGTIADQLRAMELTEMARPKHYRMSYLPQVVLPRPEPEIRIAALPEPALDPPQLPKPKPAPKPAPKPTPAPTPETPTTGGSGTGPVDNTSVDIGGLPGAEGAILPWPPFRVHCLMDDVERTETDFLRYPAIYVLGDISTEDGLTEMYHWVHYFHDILHFPNVVTPPYVLAIGEAVAQPDFLPIDAAEDVMKNRWETNAFFAGPVWGDVAFDARGELLAGLELTELTVPQIYVVDLEGYVRIRIKGRLAELSREEIMQIMGEIKKSWGMTETEFNMARLATFAWKSQLEKGTLGAPVEVDPEAMPLAIPPFQPEE